MFKLKILLVALASLTFGLLTACGKGFEGSALVPQENHEQVRRSEGEAPPAETAPSVLDQAVNEFVNERNQTGNAANASLAGQIEALSMLRTETYSRGGTTIAYRVRLLFGCDANEEILSPNTRVTEDELRSGANISLGRNSRNTHEFLLACTDSECSQAVVTVRSIDPTGVNAVVHYAMENDGSVVSRGQERVYEYSTRQSSNENFYREATVAWYLEQCLLADAEAQVGFGSNDGGIDDDLFGDGSNNEDDDMPFLGDGEEDDFDFFWQE